jgi:MFS family permease
MNKIKLVVIFTLLINVIGMGIIIPVLPHYVESFGATPFQVTLLFAVFAFCSFFSSPLLGALSDKIGRRPVLLISVVSTAIGWLVFTTAHNIFFLFLGRIIDGMAAGNISTAQSSLIDISKDAKDRTGNLGLVGAAFGIGFIIGPVIGGLLSKFSPVVPFWFTTVLAFTDVIVTFLLLDETNNKLNKQLKFNWNPVAPLVRAVHNKSLLPRFSAWFFFIMAVSAVQSTFALYLASAFGIKSFGAGMLFAASGVMIALNQIFALKKIWLKYFSEPGIELWMLLIAGVAYFAMGVNLLTLFITGLLITSIGQSLLRPVITSQIVANAPKEIQGEIIGITFSIQSVAMTFSPVIAGLAFGFKPNFPYIISCIYLVIAFSIILFIHRGRQDTGKK